MSLNLPPDGDSLCSSLSWSIHRSQKKELASCLGDQLYKFGMVLPTVKIIRPRGLRLGCGQAKGPRSSYLPKFLSGS